MTESAEDIIQAYLDCLSAWEEESHGTFSWLDDGLSWADWYYDIHAAWVSAWNDEYRKTDAVDFVRNWLTVENVNKVLMK